MRGETIIFAACSAQNKAKSFSLMDSKMLYDSDNL